MSPRALVTGAAGFVGSHLCERLLSEGWEIEAVDDLSTGLESNLAEAASAPGFSFRVQDVAGEPLEPKGPLDALLHLACPASPVQYSRLALETLAVCSRGTEHALAAAHQYGAVFVLASPSEGYGDPLEHPQREAYVGD